MTKTDEVLQRALELDAEEQAAREEALATERLHAAVREVGLDPSLLAKAERELQAKAARARRSRRVVVLAGALFALTVSAAVGAARFLSSPAPAPWSNAFEQRGAWSLDVNSASRVDLRFERETGRGAVAVVDVQRFAPEPSGAFRASLSTTAVPGDVSGYESLSVDVSGGLPGMRIELSTSGSERWLSPPIPLEASWKTHRLDLRDFQHQRYEGGKWMSIDDERPGALSRIGFELGDGVNGTAATGSVRIDDLKLE